MSFLPLHIPDTYTHINGAASLLFLQRSRTPAP